MAPRPEDSCSLLPHCGVPSQLHSESEDSKTRRDTGVELAHDFRCTDGEYTRDQVQASRGQFNWKVVEPFDGAAAMDWVSWDSVGMAERVEWRHKVVLYSNIIDSYVLLLQGGLEKLH